MTKEASPKSSYWSFNLLNPWKAPSLYGFNRQFYKCCWSIISNDIVCTMQIFFDGRLDLHEINKILLIVDPIPKYSTAQIISDFRPISLCNDIYKIISKLLTGRLIKNCSLE